MDPENPVGAQKPRLAANLPPYRERRRGTRVAWLRFLGTAGWRAWPGCATGVSTSSPKGEWIPAGEKVKVIEVGGNRVVVTPVATGALARDEPSPKDPT